MNKQEENAYCFRRTKIQNLSAIHNSKVLHFFRDFIVSDVQRYKICQQFTTLLDISNRHILLFQTYKDTKFVSNSQHHHLRFDTIAHCFRRTKIQNLSAIHNHSTSLMLKYIIVSDVQRYKICQQFTTHTRLWKRVCSLFQTYKDTKFVSNSQRYLSALKAYEYCFRRTKIQNLSAIHNFAHVVHICQIIVSDVQRYKICQQFTTNIYR